MTKLKLKMACGLILLFAMFFTTAAEAGLTVMNGGLPAGFEQVGAIQEATLNPGGAPNAGGTLTINGIKMIVPENTIIQMPANTLTWAQLFDPAVSAAIYDPSIPAPVPPAILPINHPAGMTGLALADMPSTFPPPVTVPPPYPGPFPSFNATVSGNIDVKGTAGFGVGAYIVGLILPINQDLGNAGAGFITAIDYARGRFEVNGTLGVLGTGTVIEINDPLGRHGLAHSPDPRWTVDSDNPTVTSGNGYPMGISKVAPASGLFPAPGEVGDPDRPYYNRPLNPAGVGQDRFLEPGAPLQAFFMPAKAAPNASGVATPDPWKQAPFLVGDYVSWEGILVKFNPNAPVTPFNPALPVGPGNIPLNQQIYISANTLSSDKLAIYTAPGTVATAGPAYMSFKRMVVGNGGPLNGITIPPDPGLGILGGTIPIAEVKRNILIRGWCTDSTKFVDIYAVDVNPATGVQTDRLLGTVLPEPGFAAGKGNKGRFTFSVGKGNFLPTTRLYKVKTRHGQVQAPNQTGNIVPPQGGLMTGQYFAPMFTFQFTDAPPGFPNIPNNFQNMPFLFLGEGGNPSTAPLFPFPPFTP